MQKYTFKAIGVDKTTQLVRQIEEGFRAPDDATALRHVENIIAPRSRDELFSYENAELVRGENDTVGIYSINQRTWQLGEVPHDDRPVYRGYSRNQLKPGLDLIKSPKGWKFPFDALIPADSDIALVTAAAEFFCGSPLEIEEVGDQLKVTGPGYYLCIGS